MRKSHTKTMNQARLPMAIALMASTFTVLATQKANACAGSHLDRYKIGSSLNQIVKEMSGACPSTITLNAGMEGFAVCESSRFSMHGKTIFLIGNGNRVTAIRRGPNSYGNYCAW